MRLLSSTILVSLFITSLNAGAALTPIATVVKMRGTVTKLMPGAMEATALLEGDKLPEDTSIVTSAKSFVKIKFSDNSELNMGPESKIVISEMGESSVGIISLLKGRIRTEVEKSNKAEEQTKNKFYIRTRTAAMGVRGTDFQTIYNPENRMTSLLTYNGSVAMAKIDETTHKRFEEGTTTVVRDEADPKKAPEIKIVPGKAISEKDELVKVLAGKETVLVPPGQNAFASDALKKSSLPVKISPVQLNALYKNREFDEKNLVNIKTSDNSQGARPSIPVAAQKAPVEGFYDAKSGDYAPKAGGFIDQNTGLYIAPDASATLDEKNGVYITQRSGEVDADTGQYVAPKGVILDAKKGFILDPKAEVKPELLALREDLNRSIARDIVVGDLDGEVVLMARTLNEKFIRNKLSFSFMTGSQDLKQNDDSNTSVDANGPKKLNILWQISSANRFAPLLGLSYASVEYESLGNKGYSQDTKSLISMYTGLKYALTNRVDLIAAISLDQAHYASQVSFLPTYQFKKVVVTKFNLGAQFELVRSNRWTLNGEATGKVGLRKKFNDLTVSSISGYIVKLAPQYAFDDRKSLSIGVFAGKEKSTLSNSFGSNEQKRSEQGIEFKFNWDLI